MEEFFKKIKKKFVFLKNPRIKFLGFFLGIISFVLETPLRKISHFCTEALLSFIGRDISHAGNIVEKLFTIGSPIIIIYLPTTIALWLILREGFQKIDWVLAPLLIGILLKGGIYGIISLHYKNGEFWELTQNHASRFLLWVFILIFLFSGLVGLFTWFKKIVEK